jgi:hypothetical protein
LFALLGCEEEEEEEEDRASWRWCEMVWVKGKW